MKILSEDEMQNEIVNRLNDNWVVLYGNSIAINQIEWALYKPGTSENANFEIMGSFHYVAFCKRNKKFNEMFKDSKDKKIVILHMVTIGETNRFACEIIEVDATIDNTRNYNDVAQAVIDYIQTGEFILTNGIKTI